MEFLRELAQPRLVGSTAEIKARELIEKRLKGLGLDVVKQRFAFWPFFQWLAVKTLLIVLILYLITLWAVAPQHPLAAAILAPLALALLALTMISQQRYERRICELDPAVEHPLLSALLPSVATRFETENILTTIQGPGAEQWSPHLLLMAHTDTKSQNISIVARIISVIGGLLMTLLITVLLIVGAFVPEAAGSPWLRVPLSTALLIDIGLALALIRLTVHNESPGALDNGGSCTVLMETARVLSQQPELIQGMRVSFAFTGGEELGLAGSRALVAQLEQHLGSRERLLVLNLDGVGASGNALLTAEAGLIPKGINADLVKLVSDATAERGIKLRVLKVVAGGEADHIPFLEIGVQAVTLAHFSRDTLAVHTDLDTLDKVDPQRLAQAHEIILAVLDRLRQPAPRNAVSEGSCPTQKTSQ
ncbi:MAG: M28 family peptidase [Candidatus Alcyoniella australis]|nr:M28 family peptidase [Candidatus Alcyoniella australis]